MAVTGGTRRIVGGVDPHEDCHVAAVVDEQDRVIGTRSFATTRQGYRQMLAWMRSFENYNVSESSRPAVTAQGSCASCSRQRSRSSRSRPPTSRIGVDAARTTISTPRTPPMPPLQVSGP